VALVFSVFAGIVVMIVDAVQTFETEDMERFEERLVELTLSLKAWAKNTFGIDLNSVLTEFRTEFHWVSLTKTIVVGTINGLEYVFIVFLFVLYMLFESKDETSLAFDPTASNAERFDARDLRRQIDHKIQRYLTIKTLISFVVGFSVYLVLGPILGIKMAHIFGIVTFFANFIPNFGAMVATILPIPVLILDTSLNTFTLILAVALPMLIHSIVGNAIEPKIFGDTMALHPVIVLISLSFWYTMWGIPGAILSVPTTAVIRIIVSNIQHPYATFILCVLEGKLPGSKAFHDVKVG
jgi:predicted PurR-regulated permease PerM